MSDTSQAGDMPHSAALFDRSRRVMPSGYTRHMVVAKPHPAYAAKGDGCRITDVDGNSYIDWVNNFASQIHGHNKPEIVDVIRRQVADLMVAILPTEWEVKLAELLCQRIPSLDRVRFTNSGTEANMMAVKAARAFTAKPRIAKMEGGYHGQYDLLEASFQPRPDQWGDANAPRAVAHQAGTPQSLLDEVLILPVNDIATARALVRAHADSLAAVILDPFRLQVGLVEPRHDFLAMLREETARLGILLIFDEVWSLRLGYHGAQGCLGITPDLTSMGKIIGGGLPVGAFGGSAAVMSVFEVETGDPKVKHSGTFTANPMSMAAGFTAMDLMTEAEFDRLNGLGVRMRDGLERLRVDLGVTGQVQGSGSVSALLLTDKPMGNYRELVACIGDGLLERQGLLQKQLLKEGLLTMRGGYIGSTAMDENDIDATLAGVGRALVKMKAM